MANKSVTKKTVVKKNSSSASKKKAVAKDISKLSHDLVPVHSKLSEKEKKELFEMYNIHIKQLPKILSSDAAIRHLDVKENDIIKIIRKSPTAGTIVFYRGVINE